PVLGHLAAAGAALPKSLEILLTFPFPRNSSQDSPGDYTNFEAGVNLAPIICVALANLSPADRTKAFTDEGSTISELTGVSLATLEAEGGCPTSSSAHVRSQGATASPLAGLLNGRGSR
ncbi:MAG TPA: hypothetical protein VMH41_14245, partial [Mycobacteriales bacterium]|nr:hypothetical protein [Mycobacteriales bacterium]